MNEKILNITNGDVFNENFLSKFGGEAIPFREVMMDGDTVLDIYSDEFIEVRAQALGVKIEEYKSKMLTCGGLDILGYKKLNLWFGKDTFCQMNLLTLLAYLEQIDYSGEIFLNYIDDETFETLEENVSVELGIYKNLYQEILINKNQIDNLGVLVARSIELFFDYHSKNGTLAEMVRNNVNMAQTDLICLLLQNSREYGLSDIQAKNLIDKYK